MIGYFTDPYEEELLFSACGRFADRIVFKSQRHTIYQVFGIDTITAVVDLPSNLGRFVSQLPPGHCYTVDSLIDDHTLLPYYSPFCPPERIKLVRADMAGHHGGAIHMRLGIMASQVSQHKYLQYCPECYKHDIERFGEPYLHRLPQIAGVRVCPAHNVLLESSGIPLRRDDFPYSFISAASAIQPVTARSIDLTDSSQKLFGALAVDAQWLLKQSSLCVGLEAIRLKYLDIFASLGFATYSGKIHCTKLLQTFRQTYPSDILESLSCGLDDQIQENWLYRLIRNRDTVFSPLQHLLLIHFLGYTAETFFAHVPQAPFGEPTWPCLNTVCPEFMQPSVKCCTISYDQSDGKPVGQFKCEQCSFTYIRKGPDRGANARLKIGKISSFGQLWLDELRSFAGNTDLSLREKARRLGVDPATVKLQLQKLAELDSIATVQPNLVGAETMEQCQQLWLVAKSDHPNWGTKQLRALIPDVYMYLYRHAYDWLKQNSPPSQRNKEPRKSRANWHMRDVRISKRIPDAVRKIKAKTHPFKRVTISSIAQAVGALEVIQKHLHELPITAQVLRDNVETRTQFAIRRIEMVSETYISDHVHFKRWEFIKRTGIERLKDVPEVQAVLFAAIARIKSSSEGGATNVGLVD